MYISNEQTANLKSELPRYLHMTCRPISRPFSCANPNHVDSHPSMRYDPATNKVHCFACGASYDLYDLVGVDYDIDNFNDAKIKAFEILNGTLIEKPFTYHKVEKTVVDNKIYTFNDEVEKAHLDLLDNESAIEHFTDRGLSMDIIRQYKLGYSRCGYNGMTARYPELQTRAWKQTLYTYIFPYFDENGDNPYFMCEISDRSKIDEYNDKYRKINKLKMPLFNDVYIKTDEARFLFITEGIYDALAIEEAGQKAIALTGTGNAFKLIGLIKDYMPNTAFIVMCDADEAGIKTSKVLSKGLSKLGYKGVIASPKFGKDPSEALQTDRKGFIGYLHYVVTRLKEVS